MKLLSIVQPYVPEYRVPFFEGLEDALAQSNIELRVIAGAPEGEQAARGDAAAPDWLKLTENRSLRLGTKSLNLDLTRHHWHGSDGVVLPLMGSSLGAYQALLRSGRTRVGLWGHVAPYVATGHALDLALERWQMKRASRIFAYTSGGEKFAWQQGIPRDKITVVNNAVDTSHIDGLAGRVLVDQADPYLVYIGGLDASKRVDILANALAVLRKQNSRVHLKVAGLGADAALLDEAVANNQVEMVGFVRGEEKARLLLGSRGIVVPGRIGLVAVEALAATRPIFTTQSHFHAPEAEYLTEGASVFSSRPTADDYATLLDRAFTTEPREVIRANVPTLQNMIDNFTTGIQALLSTDANGRGVA